MLVVLTLAGLAAIINATSYLRSPDFRLRRWTHKWGIQHYAAFGHAEAAGVRVRPVDHVAMGRLRRLGVFTSVAWVALVATVAIAIVIWGAPWWLSSLFLWGLLLPQLSPVFAIRRILAARVSSGVVAARAAVYTVISWILLFVGVAEIFWAVELSDAGTGVVTWAIPMLSGLALLAGAGMTAGFAKRTLARGMSVRFGRDATQDDTLFLRSFNDDAMKFRAPNPTVGKLSVFSGLSVRFEELVAFLVSDEWPLLAIGKPGESLPELGAVRTYISDADWQSEVEQTARRVGSIILVAGVTDGLSWELAHLAKWGLAQKVTILLPPVDKSQAWNRLHRLLGQLGVDLDRVTEQKETGAWLGVLLRTVTAIGVDEEGQPCFYVSGRRDWLSFGATIIESQKIVRGQMLPHEHGAIAEFIGLEVKDSVLTPIASQTTDLLAMDNLSDRARQAVTRAIELAGRIDTAVKPEHFLLALLSAEKEVIGPLEAMGVDVMALRIGLDELVALNS